MIKVFSFVASCAGEKSRTAHYSDALAAVLTKKARGLGEEILYERMTGANLRIEFCRSCNTCFEKGICPLDSMDDMASLKQKLLDSNIILFGSPVYLGDMSGLAKCVMDRISYWTHRFELAGKIGFTFATTSGSHGAETAEHMKTMLLNTGLILIRSGYAVTAVGHPNLYQKQELEVELEAISEELLSAWQNPLPFVAPKQEQIKTYRSDRNQKLKHLTDLLGKEPPEEARIWDARKIADFPSFASMVAQMKGQTWEDLKADS